VSKKERPLPRPHASPFGGKRRFEESEEDVPLMADRMASAMAEGRLEEFLKEEMPDSEHARTLTMMMLGMTGILPPEKISVLENRKDTSDDGTEGKSAAGASPTPPPEDVLRAVSAGDVKGLMRLLEREHKKRASSSAGDSEKNGKDVSAGSGHAQRETIERMVFIASENDVTLDWLILRAFKRYLEEYDRTGLL
jgi:hypothetical protein